MGITILSVAEEIEISKMSDIDLLTHSYDDPKVIIAEEMFRSKKWDLPDEFKTLTNVELNCLFFTALLKMQDQDRNCFCGKDNDDDFKEFMALWIHVKECMYPINWETY